jgi:YHS domain-containing protein
MLTTAAFVLALAMTPAQDPVLYCPVMAEPSSNPTGTFHYNGAIFQTCCGGCDEAFKLAPARFLASDKLKGKTVGIFLYDPITTLRIDGKKAKARSEHNGIVFYFASEENKRRFDAEPKRYGTLPKKEALYCTVMNHPIKHFASTGGYVDHEGTRYYVCCPACLPKLQKEPTKYVGNGARAVREPAVLDAPKK